MLGLPGDAVPFQVHVKLRPHVQQFLESLSKTYEVPGAPTFPWGLRGASGEPLRQGGGGHTRLGQPVQGPLPAPLDLHLHNCEAGLRRESPGCAGPQEEADQVMALVKPGWGPPAWQGLVPTGSASPSRRCLSQRDCLCARGCYWKDLTRLGRDLAKTVALDHTIQGFPAQVPAAMDLGRGFCVHRPTGSTTAAAAPPWPVFALSPQAANWIPVPRWWGDPRDEELPRLTPLLGQLGRAVRTGRGRAPWAPGAGRCELPRTPLRPQPSPIPVSPRAGGRAHRDPAAVPAPQAAR